MPNKSYICDKSKICDNPKCPHKILHEIKNECNNTCGWKNLIIDGNVICHTIKEKRKLKLQKLQKYEPKFYKILRKNTI